MTQKYWSQKPNSFAETVELIEEYVRDEIIREAEDKQLYYHNLDHALGVKRRSKTIFRATRSALADEYSASELNRIEGLIGLCGLAHDMVQIFEPTLPQQPRRRRSGLSERSSADKLLKYIREFNQACASESIATNILISDREQQIIRDGIMATICIIDPHTRKPEYSFSSHSIYQPYLYNAQPKISIVGTIVALADLGSLGIEGVEAYVLDGILIFFEDNPHLYDLAIDCRLNDYSQADSIGAKLLAMSSFIVDLARERQARFELEIAGFPAQIRHILRNKVFVYLNSESIDRIQSIVPSRSDTSLAELVDFFCTNHNFQIKSSILPN